MSGHAPFVPRFAGEGEIRILGRIPCRPCHVQRAFDRVLNHRVVVKALRPPREKWMPGITAPKSLIEEAQILAALQPHQAIPVLYDHDASRIIMSMAEGRNLLELVTDGDFQATPGQAAGWMRQLIAVVAHMHARGVTHHQIDPQHIIVADDLASIVLVGFNAAELQDNPDAIVRAPIRLRDDEIKIVRVAHGVAERFGIVMAADLAGMAREVLLGAITPENAMARLSELLGG